VIRYKAGYKYQLAEDYSLLVAPLLPVESIATYYSVLTFDGILTIRRGYAWDGPSGPTIDTRTFMRASLVHDALYQFIRVGILPMEHRAAADQLLRRLCLEDGMSQLRAWGVYHAVVRFGARAASHAAARPILQAP
jgi:hypothetical protein